MRLTEQFKKRLQKLAGMDSGKKAIPKRGDEVWGCICPEAFNYNPNATIMSGANDSGGWGMVYCQFLACTDPESPNYNPNTPTEASPPAPLSLENQYYEMYCESIGENVPTYGPGVDSDFIEANEAAQPKLCGYPPPPPPADCANYPAACCLQQVYGQDIFGTTVEYQGEQVNVPSVEECEGFTMIGANSTPYPHGDNTFYDGVEYTHNPNNSFEQGCCYPLI